MLAGANNLASGSVLNVDEGTLEFQATASPAVVGTGVTANVASGATLELAGSISALSTATGRVNIVNDSPAPGGGVVISGTNQQVGNLDGAGDTTIDAGASLIANRIQQTSLILGGTASQPASLTIAAADAAGNPLWARRARAEPGR